jgi:prepilin signal peptidase PulO-like enzyme (type II secretory pathway)
MIRRRHRDPWWGDEGKGAKRTRRRTQVESALAFGLAIAAAGLTAALWLRQLAPFAHQLGLG